MPSRTMKVPMSTGTRSREAPSAWPRRRDDGEQGQAHRGRHERPDERPHGQRVVGAEATEPSEAVYRGEGVADGQRVGDGLRRKRQLEQRLPRARRCPALSRSNCMAASSNRSRSRPAPPAGTHHQSNVRKTVLKPSSSESWRRAPTGRPRPGRTHDDAGSRPGLAQGPASGAGGPVRRPARGRPHRPASRPAAAAGGRWCARVSGASSGTSRVRGACPPRPRGRPRRTPGPSGEALSGPGVGEPLPGELPGSRA